MEGPWADTERGTGGPDPSPLKNHKNIGFPSNIDLDPPKKLPSQHSMVGQQSNISTLSPSNQKKMSVLTPSGSAHEV